MSNELPTKSEPIIGRDEGSGALVMTDEFCVVRKDGSWTARIPSAYELMDVFTRVTDPSEASALLQEAANAVESDPSILIQKSKTTDEHQDKRLPLLRAKIRIVQSLLKRNQ